MWYQTYLTPLNTSKVSNQTNFNALKTSILEAVALMLLVKSGFLPQQMPVLLQIVEGVFIWLLE